MATIDIYIYEDGKKKNTGIRIPWLPSEISVGYGDLRAASYEILDQGEVNIPAGNNLCRVSWSGIFPGESRKKMPFIRGSLSKPKTYVDKLESWKKSGKKLKLLVSGTNINMNVYLESFSARHYGGYGDISYEITFKQRRDIVIKTIKVAAKKKNKPKAPTVSNEVTYKIKSGDTLWGIASTHLNSGSRWSEIYNLNKTIIEDTARKYGYSSSDGGHWIFPGVTIKIPKK